MLIPKPIPAIDSLEGTEDKASSQLQIYKDTHLKDASLPN